MKMLLFCINLCCCVLYHSVCTNSVQYRLFRKYNMPW
jgi:hypothetical protein